METIGNRTMTTDTQTLFGVGKTASELFFHPLFEIRDLFFQIFNVALGRSFIHEPSSLSKKSYSHGNNNDYQKEHNNNEKNEHEAQEKMRMGRKNHRTILPKSSKSVKNMV